MNNPQNPQAIIFDFNRTIYDPETENLLPFTLDILSYCSTQYDCYLVSFNEKNRLTLMDDLGIKKFFRDIWVVEKKEPEHFKNIVAKVPYEKVYVVGDRIKGEITIGNQLGYETVWLKRGKFKDEIPAGKYENPRHTIHSLEELKTIL